MRKFIFILIFLFIFVLAKAEKFKYPYRSFYNRDPLKPLINEEGKIVISEKRRGFVLQGIVYRGKSNSVIINNTLYKEGDIIEGFKIKRVEEDKVILEKEGKEFILKWEEK